MANGVPVSRRHRTAVAATGNDNLFRVQRQSYFASTATTYPPAAFTTTPAPEALLLQRGVPMTDPICRCGHTLSFHLEHWPACKGFTMRQAGREDIPSPCATGSLGGKARPAYNPKHITFEDANEGFDGCPSELQIRERAAILRSHWDRVRWAKERRKHVSEDTHKTSCQRDEQFKSSDAALIRQLLWTEDDPAADKLKEHHKRLREKKCATT